jgi:hypothetical protein
LIRVNDLTPVFKLYILNNVEVFFGYYTITKRTVTVDGARTPVYDPMGKDATLFNYRVDDDNASHGTRFVQASRPMVRAKLDHYREALHTMIFGFGELAAVIFAFDGPICSVYAGVLAPRVTSDLGELARQRDARVAAIEGQDDPMEVLTCAGRENAELLTLIEDPLIG